MLQSKGGSAADVGGHAEAAVDDDGGNVSNQSSQVFNLSCCWFHFQMRQSISISDLFPHFDPHTLPRYIPITTVCRSIGLVVEDMNELHTYWILDFVWVFRF